jgi:type I restriction enzyme M protein
MNDKFAFEVKKLDSKLQKAENWEKEISTYPDDDYEMLLLQWEPTRQTKPQHFISELLAVKRKRFCQIV